MGSSSGGFRPSSSAHLPKMIRGACRILSALLVGPRGRCGGEVPSPCVLLWVSSEPMPLPPFPPSGGAPSTSIGA
eukprot:180815-Pyramimonas_sp.AAC.1